MKRSEQVFIYGKQPVTEAIESGWPISELIIRGNSDDGLVRILAERARAKGAGVLFMRPRLLPMAIPRHFLRWKRALEGRCRRMPLPSM